MAATNEFMWPMSQRRDQVHVCAELLRELPRKLQGIRQRARGCLETEPEQLRSAIQAIERTCDEVQQLVVTLCTLAGHQPYRPEWRAIGPWLTDQASMLATAVPQIALNLQVQDELSPVPFDGQQLGQALLELVQSSADAGASNVSVTVRRRELVGDDLPPDLSRGTYLRVEISDDGQGISAPTTTAALHPLFSTRRQRGLGLSMVYGVVQQHGGTMQLESHAGQGTTVVLHLPCDRRAPSEDPTTADAPMLPSETLLLVDDDRMARSATLRLLSSLGYRVVAAAGGEQALALLSNSDECIDLVISDVNMPGMSGFELARRIGAIRPTLRTLFLSGYPPETLSDAPAHARFVEKPFTRSDLACQVRGMLDRGKD